MIEKMNTRLHATVHGRVQGVGFRYFVIETAARLEISGWVRNRFDGTVEVLAEGRRPQLENLVQQLQRGPRPSNVTKVDLSWEDAAGEFTGFHSRRTG